MKYKNTIFFSIIIALLWAGWYFNFQADNNRREIAYQNHGEEFTEENKPQYSMGKIEIKKQNGEIINFQVDVADDAFKRSFGLMYVKEMPENKGMFFIFPDVTIRNFWMKNTYIPLDIVYIGSDFEIKHIGKNAVPHSTEFVNSIYPAKYVLEINAGLADKLGLDRGDIVKFEKEKGNFEN
ncbi:MAG: DUF192 domain-containing protein [Rickettsiales bacterium]|nr:DUF192 domain-containing protein [Rickettsiales bacterium]